MAEQLETQEDAMQEILRRAIRKEGSDDAALQTRLLAAADELGISRQAVLAAQDEYRIEQERSQELAAFRRHRKQEFTTHLCAFVGVNFFLALINFLTYRDDRQIWALYPLFGWGIGLVIHAIIALQKPSWDDEEFQKWRKWEMNEE